MAIEVQRTCEGSLLGIIGTTLVKGDKSGYNCINMAKKRTGSRAERNQRVFVVLGLLVAFSMAISYICAVAPPPPPPSTPTPAVYITPTSTPVF